jgi:hypothetical protein
LNGGGLAVDLAQDRGDTLDGLGREHADVTCNGLGLDATGLDGVLDAVDGLT